MLNLAPLKETLAVCRLDVGAAIPAWATRGPFFSVTRTADELSVVCAEADVPSGVKSELGWRCLKVAGPLDFSLTGILASLVAPLAAQGISIFALSTFETDYLLVKASRFEEACASLKQSGHSIA